MKATTGCALGAILALGGFAAGAWFASVGGWGTNAVAATLVNESGMAVLRAHVRFESCGLQGAAIVGRLEPGQRRTVRYSLCGEGSYAVEADLADGRVLKHEGGYVESGYRTEHIVRADRIASSLAVY